MATAQCLGTRQRSVCTLAPAIGKRAADERPLEHGLDHVTEGVMNDAIAEGCGGNQAALGLVDKEVRVRFGESDWWLAAASSGGRTSGQRSASQLVAYASVSRLRRIPAVEIKTRRRDQRTQRSEDQVPGQDATTRNPR